MRIMNFTPHRATDAQRSDGVIDPSDKRRAAITAALTFNVPPSRRDIIKRALHCALLAEDWSAELGSSSAMIGGEPFFMRALEGALKDIGISPMYAFSSSENAGFVEAL